VLRGKPAPAPFDFGADDSERKKEALLLLSHLVGDVHQPLHVGAIYLSAQGALVDPDAVGKLDPETDTEGGNKIVLDGKNLYIQWWDDAPNAWDLNMVKMLMRDVPEFPMQADELDGIVEYWASESVERAAGMFAGLTFQPKTRVGSKEVWLATSANLTEYAKGVDFTSQISVRLAGSRLAAMLNALWP
jgi:hypothetical protein